MYGKHRWDYWILGKDVLSVLLSKPDLTKLLKYSAWLSHWNCEVTTNKPRKIVICQDTFNQPALIYREFYIYIYIYIYMGCVSCDNNVYTFQVKERSSIQLRLVFPMNASGEIQIHKILWINNAVRPGWVVPFSRKSPYRVSVHNETNVLLQDFVKSRSREIRI